jgi:hypothetical protein
MVSSITQNFPQYSMANNVMVNHRWVVAGPIQKEARPIGYSQEESIKNRWIADPNRPYCRNRKRSKIGYN